MGIATTALQNLITHAFLRFARDVVARTLAKGEQGTYNYHAQEYTISVVKDAGFPNNVPIKIFFQDNLEVASGHLGLLDRCSAKITSELGDHLSMISATLNGMLDRGEFDGIYGYTREKTAPLDAMLDAGFKNALTKFNRMIVSPAQQAHPAGKYQWPLGDYTLEVDFPESKDVNLIPFTIFLAESGSLARGGFNTSTWEIVDLVCGQSIHAIGIYDSLSRMLETKFHTFGMDSEEQLSEPPMVLITNNTPDISDEWVKWFCERNPGTSYAKAIHAALTHLTTEARKLKAIVDKYAINRY